jgi:UDP-GlcNAc:undecaprenyl-phosphate GlcNAc-1-phosphate transferase
MIAALACIWLFDPEIWSGWLSPVIAHLDGLRRHSRLAVAVVVALAVLHAMGLIDDRIGLSAAWKLAVQVLVALVLTSLFEIRIFRFLEIAGPWGFAASTVLSVLWIVVITNAMNMLDNMDGLAAGVGAIIAGFYLVATLIGGQWFVAALAALLLGALVGFLVFNFPPARIFMGDGGSMVVGLVLAVISVRTTYYESCWPVAGIGLAANGAWHSVLMPLVILSVPLYDLASVCLIRLRAGRSLFVGDQNHLSHRLVRRGMSRRAAIGVIWLATVATGLGGLMFNMLDLWQAVLIAFQTLIILTVLAMLEK